MQDTSSSEICETQAMKIINKYIIFMHSYNYPHPLFSMFSFTKHILLSLSAFFIELGCIPLHEQLRHLAVMGRSITPLPEQHQLHGSENNSALFNGAGLPQCLENYYKNTIRRLCRHVRTTYFLTD